MSWSCSFTKPVPKAEALESINNLELGLGAGSPEALDQLQTAKGAAKILLLNIPGPYIMVTLSGHANGVGWHKKEGWAANDCITVNVTQLCEEDLKYYA